MKIIAEYFCCANDQTYNKLSKVLEYSVKKYCPTAEFQLIKNEAPKRITDLYWKESNLLKLDEWVKAIDATDQNIIFLDADMVVLRDLSDAFDDDFDIGLTKLPEGDKLPYNGGVVFVRNNQKARDFMLMWNDADKKLFSDPVLHQVWRKKYAGMNQASLGYLLETGGFEAKIKNFCCKEWNHCRDNWPVSDITRILHIKSQTRRNVMLPTPLHMLNIPLRGAVQIWRRLAAEAQIQTFPEDAVQVSESAHDSKFGGFVFHSKVPAR